MHLASEHPNEDTGDDALDCGPDNDANDLRPRLRRKPCGHPVDGAQDSAQQETQKNLVHRSSSSLMWYYPFFQVSLTARKQNKQNADDQINCNQDYRGAMPGE